MQSVEGHPLTALEINPFSWKWVPGVWMYQSGMFFSWAQMANTSNERSNQLKPKWINGCGTWHCSSPEVYLIWARSWIRRANAQVAILGRKHERISFFSFLQSEGTYRKRMFWRSTTLKDGRRRDRGRKHPKCSLKRENMQRRRNANIGNEIRWEKMKQNCKKERFNSINTTAGAHSLNKQVTNMSGCLHSFGLLHTRYKWYHKSVHVLKLLVPFFAFCQRDICSLINSVASLPFISHKRHQKRNITSINHRWL